VAIVMDVKQLALETELVIMKNLKAGLMTLGTAALLTLVAGCMTTRQTEDLLSEAGFKKIDAVTPQQQAHLKSLPAHQVTTVLRDGSEYYLYPDVRHLLLYVGQRQQYEKYEELCQQYKQAVYRSNEWIMNQEAIQSTWGDWR
jgi:hypothetical protein